MENKAYNTKDLRVITGISQNILAQETGLTPVYISQIELGKRRLTNETAEKIAKAYIRLLLGYGEYDYELDPEEEYLHDIKIKKGVIKEAQDIMANHLASFYPEEVQGRILQLMDQKQKAEEELEEILKTGNEVIRTPDQELQDQYDDLTLYEKLMINKETVRSNVKKLEEKYKMSRKNATLLKR